MEKKTGKEWLTLFLAFVLVIGMVIVELFGGGFVLWYWWNGIFRHVITLPLISVVQGAAIFAFFNWLLALKAPKDPDRDIFQTFRHVITLDVMTLIIGLVIVHFI